SEQLKDPRMRYHASNVSNGLDMLEKFQSLAATITEALAWIVVEGAFEKHQSLLKSMRRRKRKSYPGLLHHAQMFRRVGRFVPLTTLAAYLLNPGTPHDDPILDTAGGLDTYRHRLHIIK